MTEKERDRKPPTEVRRALRREVGFGCPVEGCGSPYLTYHHFDPPWAQEKHHDPARMIALCREHHDKASALSVDDCRQLKRVDPDRQDVRGSFLWRKDKILAVVGGNYFWNVRYFLTYMDNPIVWTNWDERGRLVLCFTPLVVDGEVPHTKMIDNDWIIDGAPEEVDSPPSGNFLSVKYPCGDQMDIRFREHADRNELVARFPSMQYCTWDDLEFPLVSVEVNLAIGGGGDLRLTPKGSNISGMTITDNFFRDRERGFDAGHMRWVYG